MDTSNLSQLESSVSQILERFQALQKENSLLRRDRDNLIEKNRLAGSKIESMISKLKEMD